VRKLRLAAPAQLSLGIPGLVTTPVERWWSLPREVQEAVVCIVSRMGTGGVIEKEMGGDHTHRRAAVEGSEYSVVSDRRRTLHHRAEICPLCVGEGRWTHRLPLAASRATRADGLRVVTLTGGNGRPNKFGGGPQDKRANLGYEQHTMGPGRQRRRPALRRRLLCVDLSEEQLVAECSRPRRPP
jgi:hypothetical protein